MKKSINACLHKMTYRFLLRHASKNICRKLLTVTFPVNKVIYDFVLHVPNSTCAFDLFKINLPGPFCSADQCLNNIAGAYFSKWILWRDGCTSSYTTLRDVESVISWKKWEKEHLNFKIKNVYILRRKQYISSMDYRACLSRIRIKWIIQRILGNISRKLNIYYRKVRII